MEIKDININKEIVNMTVIMQKIIIIIIKIMLIVLMITTSKIEEIIGAM